MPDQITDALDEVPVRPRARRTPRTDWRLGGTTVRRWREGVLAVALVSLGVSLLAGLLIGTLWSSSLAPVVGTAVVGIGMLVPVVWAFSRSRPIGLLRFRAVDLLYGLALGGLLRMTQGWLEVGVGGSGALPSVGSAGEGAPLSWWLAEALPSIVVAAPLEELFFRGVVLVALYTVLRRPFGKLAAGIAAGLGSAGLFVAIHALASTATVDATLSLLLLGLTCGALVLLTGRLWGAVLVHVVYNATFVLLAVAGTALG